jgi:hypothetical protein
MEILTKSGKEPTEAIAETRASQILAEMLGIICHPEYYRSGQDQMVLNNFFSLSSLSLTFDIIGYHSTFRWVLRVSIFCCVSCRVPSMSS